MKHIVFSAGVSAATVVATLCFGGQAIAGPGYICASSTPGNHGFLPPEMFIKLDEKAGTAIINDWVIDTEHDGPITVKAKAAAGGKYVMRWVGKFDETNAGRVRVNFSARFDPARKSYSISGTMVGWSNQIRGSGACRIAR